MIWLILSILFIGGAACLPYIRRWMHLTNPRCASCEYSFDGHEPNRCPECGADTDGVFSPIPPVRRLLTRTCLAALVLACLLALPSFALSTIYDAAIQYEATPNKDAARNLRRLYVESYEAEGIDRIEISAPPNISMKNFGKTIVANAEELVAQLRFYRTDGEVLIWYPAEFTTADDVEQWMIASGIEQTIDDYATSVQVPAFERRRIAQRLAINIGAVTAATRGQTPSFDIAPNIWRDGKNVTLGGWTPAPGTTTTRDDETFKELPAIVIYVFAFAIWIALVIRCYTKMAIQRLDGSDAGQ